MTSTTRTTFEFLAVDPTPDAYPPPFREEERWVVYKSESQRVLEDARVFLAERGVLVHAVQRVTR